ncbi:MAG TPA: rod shape-determining protein MreC [Vicinamibacteria bacterium]
MARVYETRRSGFLLAGLVLAHLIVISRQVDGGVHASLLERAAYAIFSPIQRLIAGAVYGVKNGWSGYVGLRGVRQENLRLEERLRTLESLLQERQQQAQEAVRLRELLELRQALPMETIAGEVIARDGVPWFRTILVDKGTADGVDLDDPVIGSSGVVGRVIAVGARAAKVQLLVDRDSGVGARIERSRITGVIAGQVGNANTGSTDLQLKYVPALADVVVGDVVVTSGLDGIFPKGLVIGRVRSVAAPSGLFKDVVVVPSARLEKLEEVMVVRRNRTQAVLDRSLR